MPVIGFDLSDMDEVERELMETRLSAQARSEGISVDELIANMTHDALDTVLNSLIGPHEGLMRNPRLLN